MKYPFEEPGLSRNDLPVVQARRFAGGIRQAINRLEHFGRGYGLEDEPYYRDVMDYLYAMQARLSGETEDTE